MADHAEAYAEVIAAYEGSNGDATKALYERLEKLGAAGSVASALMRAQKWALSQLECALIDCADFLSLRWGWGVDDAQPFHKQVLYVDLPTGQVSFHTAQRGQGPDYPGEWDRVEGRSPERILRFAARVLAAAAVPA